jgi:hypothetical protein
MTTLSQTKRFFELGVTLLSALASAIAVGLVVFNGGSLCERVKSHEGRLSRIEAQPLLVDHEKLDDEREARTVERITHLEQATEAFRTLQLEVKGMSVKLDTLTRTIEGRGAGNRSSEGRPAGS